MKLRRGKLVGRVAVTLGIVVLSAAGFASWRPLLEHWQLSRLQSADEETRKKAAQALGEYGSARSIPLLLKANSDSLTSLLREKGKPDALLGREKYFATMLDHQDKLAREVWPISPDGAARRLGFLKNGWGALDRRIEDLATEVSTTLAISPYALSLRRTVEREKEAAVPYLSRGLESDDWQVRWLAVTLLDSLGSDAEDAVPVLKAKTEDPNSFVRHAALNALREFAGRSARL